MSAHINTYFYIGASAKLATGPPLLDQ